MNTTKIVVIGAGSMCFGLSMFKDIFSCGELAGSTLTLVDINEENLDRMYDLAVTMNKKSNAGLTIEKTTDRREALPGAGFVVNSIAIERTKLWQLDFEIPKKYGIRHTLGENGGPGGLFFSMRTIPLILDIVRDMEELCPDAFFLNFSNPESRIIMALGRYSKVKSVGLCHGVFMGRDDISKIMGRKSEEIDVFAAGLNHFQWFLGVREKGTGKDLYPELREKEKSFNPSFNPLSRKLMKAFGHWPSCSDDHIGEYIAYGWEGGEHGYDFDKDAAERVQLRNDIEARVSGKTDISDWICPSGEKAVATITAILHNKKETIESGVIYNRNAIANLPYDAAVEVPIMVDRNGIHPISVELPTPIARLCTVQVQVQQMAVDAAVFGSKEMALQCLLIDPVITSTDAAVGIVNELWEYNKQYIRNVFEVRERELSLA